MSFIKSFKRSPKPNSTNIKKPFYKKKGWKVFFVIFGILLICLASFLAYIYATGSKIFENGIGGSSLVRAIKGDKLNGEEDGRVNILLMGRGGDNHPGGLLTDSLLVASIDVKNKKMALISVPRDLYVPIKNHGSDKINAAFAYGYKDYLSDNCKKKKQSDCVDDASIAGAQLTRETVSNVLGIPVQYHVMIDFEGFKQLVDKLGGVDIYVDKAIYDPLYPDKEMKGYDPLYIKAGQQHMDGELALKYSRSRETTSDFDRSRRQQQVISAVRDKMLKAGVLANPKTVLDLVTIVGNHLRTNFTPAELKILAEMINGIDQNTMVTKVLSSANDSYLVSDSSSGTFYLKPKTGNFDAIKDMVKNIFSEDASNKTALKVEVLNASKISGQASKIASELKVNSQFDVVTVKTAEEKSKTTKIYDYSGGTNKSAISFLEKKYNTKVIQRTRNTGDSVDISIIIGDDFSASS
ncbi:MAG: LCP family protein [Patescibacteria group bacterium]